MKNSVKLFIASLIVLAAAIGFFVGSVCNKPCPKGPVAMEGMMPPPPPGFDGKMPPPGFDGKNPPPGFEGKMPPPGMKGPHGPGMPPQGMKDHKGPHGNFDKGPSPEVMDSILQVTPEQKAALEQNRNQADSTLKELRKQKLEAEKALGEALDAGDAAGINAAKTKVLDAHKALLEHRIAGVDALSKILTKEQMEKFRSFHKVLFKGKKGKLPHGNPPQPPQGEQPQPKK